MKTAPSGLFSRKGIKLDDAGGEYPDSRSYESLPAGGHAVTLEKIEEEHLRRILAATKSLQKSADILGIDQAIFWHRYKKYGI
ncbi:MAG: hypothetical protein C0407_03820 [Desulfobacca sp.]|nr:hypothetical protein [Desulfobacca sp.]